MKSMTKLTHESLLLALGTKFDAKTSRRKPSSAGSAQPTTKLAALMYEHAAKTTCSDHRQIIDGNRNVELTSIAGALRRKGKNEAEMLAALRQINSQDVKPPLDDAEVSQIASSVARYDPASIYSPSGRSLNDTGNAQRLVEKFGVGIRYVPLHSKWFVWTPRQRWEEDASGWMIEMAKQAARDIHHEAAEATDSKTADPIARHAVRSGDVARLKAMVDLSKTDPRVVIDPKQLDRNPALLGVENGVIELASGKLRQNRQADMVTRYAPVVFDPKATCPVFEQFVSTVTDANPKLIAYLQRVVGYALSGNTSEQVLFFLYGSGANGKSTFLNVVSQLLGHDLARQLPYDSLVAKPHGRGASNDLARLDRVRVVQTSEVEDGSRLAESLIKQVTGGEPIAARFLYGEFFEFVPQFKLFIAGNHRPIIQGDDHGIWRRIHLVPFVVTIPLEVRDPDLGAKLEAERSGILNWAVKGYRKWKRTGLAPPAVVTAAVEEYRSEMDLMGRWIEERCDVGPDKRANAGELFQSYKNWSEHNGLRHMTGPPFGRKLQSRFVRKETSRGRHYEGIALIRSESFFDRS